jgi:hypothetical protein
VRKKQKTKSLDVGGQNSGGKGPPAGRGDSVCGGFGIELSQPMIARKGYPVKYYYDVVLVRTIQEMGNGSLAAGSRRKERINTEHTEGKRHGEHREEFE